MKIFLLLVMLISSVYAQTRPTPATITNAFVKDTVSELTVLLNNLVQSSDNDLFKQHCKSIIQVIAGEVDISVSESAFLKDMFLTFADTSNLLNAGEITTYLQRKCPFIISWKSPRDGIVSLGWLLLPQNWNPEQVYPLYIYLHGLSSPYENKIEYMTRYFKPDSLMNKPFENGYSFYPWGRGNIWYEGIGERDIWEGINEVENIVKIDKTKKYLLGHSMGGYGAWALGTKSPDTWAAIGVYAGALWYNNYMYLNIEAAKKIKDVPVYIVCGDQDGLLSNNQTAFQLLQQAGNPNIKFVSFHGGHESLLENWQDMYAWIKNWQKGNVNSAEENKEFNFNLFYNYPNPFNPATKIKYSVDGASNGQNDHPVTLIIYDVLGKEIATLVNEKKPTGVYEIEFNASRYNICSGIYFYILNNGEHLSVKKMVYIK